MKRVQFEDNAIIIEIIHSVLKHFNRIEA